MFNHKKMDGMGLIINVVNEKETEKKGYMHVTGQVAILLTNNLENKFVVDGIHLTSLAPMSKKGMEHFIKFVKANSIFKPEVKKINEVSKPEKKKRSDEEKNIMYYATTSTWFSTSASTTNYG